MVLVCCFLNYSSNKYCISTDESSENVHFDLDNIYEEAHVGQNEGSEEKSPDRKKEKKEKKKNRSFDNGVYCALCNMT